MEGLQVQISKTSDGLRDYLQITSPDQVSINIVLIANQITVEDHRGVQKKEKTRHKQKG